MSNDTFLATLDEFVQITNEITGKLNEELEWINKHHQRCLAAKSVGTVASVGGTVVLAGSLILAPFTGGASLVAAAGYGAAAAATGAGISIATTVADMIAQRIEKGQIEEICARRNEVASRLQEYFDELERVVVELKKLDVDDERAYLLSLTNIVSKGNRIRTSTQEIIQLSKCAQSASGTSSMLLSDGAYVWKGMKLQSEGLMKAFAYFGFNVGKAGTMAVVRSGTILLSGVFAIYDVYSLIQAIKTNHPTADAISEMIKQMNEELEQIEEFRKVTSEIHKQK